MSDIKLLPCPFCGGNPKTGTLSDGGEYVECEDCGASSTAVHVKPTENPAPKLEALWNTRNMKTFEQFDGEKWVPLSESEFTTA